MNTHKSHQTAFFYDNPPSCVRMGNEDDTVNNAEKFVRLNDLMFARCFKKRT